MIKSLFAVLVAAILTENYILSKYLGICPFLGVSKKTRTALGMSVAVLFVMTVSTAVTYPLYFYILDRLELQYLQTVVFILIIASLVQLIELLMKKYMKQLYASLGIYLPLITTNCAVLGITMMTVDKTGDAYGFAHAMINAVGSGLGYMLAMVMFSGVREKLETADIPEFFKGMPITLVAAGLIALSFLGFQGITNVLV